MRIESSNMTRGSAAPRALLSSYVDPYLGASWLRPRRSSPSPSTIRRSRRAQIRVSLRGLCRGAAAGPAELTWLRSIGRRHLNLNLSGRNHGPRRAETSSPSQTSRISSRLPRARAASANRPRRPIWRSPGRPRAPGSGCWTRTFTVPASRMMMGLAGQHAGRAPTASTSSPLRAHGSRSCRSAS